ncbi:DEKNAAC102523 [Brettanomyces naardenensis]|uniref:DEKNAAC102523 n=1 Tax=Brettanomyces naardenensis TaxID=13370 RepID=A0A448YL22_BRENA|nr:DEKNAAC102523 [Brettanomyces naardenensis]
MSFEAESGFLEQVDGSSTFEFADTKVISSVAGPLEISRMKNEKATEAFLDINILPASGVSSTRESLLESKLLSILSKVIDVSQYPRKQIQIVIQMVSPGESQLYTVKELTAIVNSVYISLLNSGISLQTSFLATCCSISPSGDIITRPTAKQLESSRSHTISVFSITDAASDSLIYSDSEGTFTEEELLRVLDSCAEDIQSMNEKVREVVHNRVKGDYIWHI